MTKLHSVLTGIALLFCAAAVTSAQTFATLANFSGSNGSAPYYGSLIQGSDGNFYGTTSSGGANGQGTFFQLTPGGALNTLYSFCSQQGCSDGANPYAGLVQVNGVFYGTTYGGGNNGAGTVFQITLTGQEATETPLYSFCSQISCNDGSGPTAGLILASDGNLYGTTHAGGGGNCGKGCGTVFQITLAGVLKTFHFTNSDGSQIFSGVIQASDGNLYGTAQSGGASSHGTIFKATLSSGTVTPLYNFCSQTNCPDGAHPYAGLIQATDGNLYGTTYNGGNNGCSGTSCGIIFQFNLQTDVLTTLYSFCSQTNCSDGSHPYAGVIQAADGNLYGTTSAGGANSYGSVFKLSLAQNSQNKLYTLYSFDVTDGEYPYGGIFQASSGNLYGTTNSGGSNGDGTIFAIYQANVVTWHNDNLRTGQNTSEITLTPNNLSADNFGELCTKPLDGQVYAQPLVLSNVTFQGAQYASLVYVVTQENTLYVMNGTPGADGGCNIVASISLNPPGEYPADCFYVGNQTCGTVKPVLGALGTPAIQTTPQIPSSIGTLYVVTENQNVPVGGVPSAWFHNLHVVNLDQVQEVASVRIYPPQPMLFATQASYWSRQHIQRPGLLVVGNNLYIGFSMMDGLSPLPNGSVFRYDVTNINAAPLYFSTTATANSGGGVWQGAAGLAYGPDDNGTPYVYFNTGNGIYDGNANWGDSFIKLDPGSLAVSASFTPSDQAYRNCGTDLDFGSTGVVLTPPPPASSWPFLAISGDKEGGIWAMDLAKPGGFNPGQCSGCNACPPNQQDNQNVQTYWLNGGNGPTIHNTPAYWNNNIFFGVQAGPVYQFPICSQASGEPFCGTPIQATDFNKNVITTKYGATPSVSAAPGASDAIVWLTSGGNEPEGDKGGGLIALDAVTMDELYVNTGSGSSCAGDWIAPVIKFSVPTVANGYVYVGTQALYQGSNNGAGMFYTFGLNRQCSGSLKRRANSQTHKPAGKKDSLTLK